MANQERVDLLKQGAMTWNLWRVENLNIKIDLSSANLSSANLSSANLSSADLSSADLRSANLSRADLRSADLTDANLSRADLTDARLRDANLTDANLTDAILYSANFQSADLTDARLRSANLTDASLYSANLQSADLTDANLTDAILYSANLQSADLTNAKLCGADLSSAKLSGAKLCGVDLRSAKLKSTDFFSANLSSTNLTATNLRSAKLHYANLSFAKLSYIDLSYIDLSYMDLSGANLSYADLSYADLKGAKLSKANLTSVNLYRIQALATNFSLSDLSGSCIHEWYINTETKFDGVKCSSIYRGYKDNEFIDRLPVNPEQEFKPGEFEQWIKILDHARQTIDLTFTNGIDWQAFFESLQGVRQEHPEADVGLQAIEEKGTAFVIRLKTSPEADLSAIESTQKEIYETRLQLRESQGENRVLREMNDVLKQLAGRPMTHNETTIHAQTIGTQHSGSGNITDFTQTIGNGERQTPAESAKEIQDLLIQLQSTNPPDIEAVVAKRVKCDPTLRARFRNALKEGGLETMKVIFPLLGIAIETVRGWVDAEGDE